MQVCLMLQLSYIPGITWKIQINRKWVAMEECGGGGKWKMVQNVWVSGSTLCGDFLELAADHAKKQLHLGKATRKGTSTKVGSEKCKGLRGGVGGCAGVFTLISKATREHTSICIENFNLVRPENKKSKSRQICSTKQTRHTRQAGGGGMGEGKKRRREKRKIDRDRGTDRQT